MNIFFSAVTRGFYCDFPYESLPADAVEISQDLYQFVMEGQANGKQIASDVNSMPVLIDWPASPPLSSEQLADQAAREQDRLLGIAAIRIAPLQDAVDLSDASASEIALLKKWKQYRVAVSREDLTANPIAWPATPE